MIRRIVTARHQLEMLAPWRTASGPQFYFRNIFGARVTAGHVLPWGPSHRFPKAPHELAYLENGHVLGVFGPPSHDPDRGWEWYLWSGPKDQDGNQDVTGGGVGWKDWPDRAYSTEHLPTIDHAKAAAEEAYFKLHPMGSGSDGSPKPSFDYDSHLKPEPLDDDFGDIFGSGS